MVHLEYYGQGNVGPGTGLNPSWEYFWVEFACSTQSCRFSQVSFLRPKTLNVRLTGNFKLSLGISERANSCLSLCQLRQPVGGLPSPSHKAVMHYKPRFSVFAAALMGQFRPDFWNPETCGSIQAELLGPICVVD